MAASLLPPLVPPSRVVRASVRARARAPFVDDRAMGGSVGCFVGAPSGVATSWTPAAAVGTWASSTTAAAASAAPRWGCAGGMAGRLPQRALSAAAGAARPPPTATYADANGVDAARLQLRLGEAPLLELDASAYTIRCGRRDAQAVLHVHGLQGTTDEAFVLDDCRCVASAAV